MTRQGKCDVCRSRKVKCDEKRPTCGQCRKKKRPCRYEYSKTSRFSKVRTVEAGISCTDLAIPSQDTHGKLAGKDPSGKIMTLTVRSVKEAKDGHGIFHTFNVVHSKSGRLIRVRNPHFLSNKIYPDDRGIPQPVVSREMYICAHFTEILGEKGANWNATFLWGCWISSVPSRLGRNTALDDAAECFVAANSAYHLKRGIDDAIASKKYATALVSLQKVLDSSEDMRYSTETTAAVNLLLLIEEVLAFRELRWQSHSRGLIQLLLARGPQGTADDMSRSMFYATLNHDFSEAMLGGSQSSFDSQEWLSFPPPENPSMECVDFTLSSGEIARQTIQLPRLIALVRRIRKDPFEIDAGIEALTLAEHLYCSYSSNIAPTINAALIKRAEWVETLDENLARYCPQSLQVEWFNIFEGLVRYCYVRIMVLSMCMTLRDIFPFSPILDAALLEEEEDRCATWIAASVQYAEKQQPFPLGALIMRLPLQVVYGTWSRRQRYASVECDLSGEKEKAVFMENWCLEKINKFIGVLNGDPVSKSELQAMCITTAEGGPWEGMDSKGPLV